MILSLPISTEFLIVLNCLYFVFVAFVDVQRREDLLDRTFQATLG